MTPDHAIEVDDAKNNNNLQKSLMAWRGKTKTQTKDFQSGTYGQSHANTNTVLSMNLDSSK